MTIGTNVTTQFRAWFQWAQSIGSNCCSGMQARKSIPLSWLRSLDHIYRRRRRRRLGEELPDRSDDRTHPIGVEIDLLVTATGLATSAKLRGFRWEVVEIVRRTELKLTSSLYLDFSQKPLLSAVWCSHSRTWVQCAAEYTYNGAYRIERSPSPNWYNVYCQEYTIYTVLHVVQNGF